MGRGLIEGISYRYKKNWKGGFKNKMKKKYVHQNSIYFFINGI